MKRDTFSIDSLATSAGTVSVTLPADVAKQLEQEAKASRKPIASILRQWLEDQSDAREAARVIKRIRSGKEKVHPAAEVYARLGI